MIESMNFRLPIITSNVRGCRDLVQVGHNGFIGEKNDYKYYAEVIQKLMDNPELKMQMGENVFVVRTN